MSRLTLSNSGNVHIESGLYRWKTGLDLQGRLTCFLVRHGNLKMWGWEHVYAKKVNLCVWLEQSIIKNYFLYSIGK